MALILLDKNPKLNQTFKSAHKLLHNFSPSPIRTSYQKTKSNEEQKFQNCTSANKARSISPFIHPNSTYANIFEHLSDQKLKRRNKKQSLYKQKRCSQFSVQEGRKSLKKKYENRRLSKNIIKSERQNPSFGSKSRSRSKNNLSYPLGGKMGERSLCREEMKHVFKKLLNEHSELVVRFLQNQIALVVPISLEEMEIEFNHKMDLKLNKKLGQIINYMLDLMDEKLLRLFDDHIFCKNLKPVTFFPDKNQIVKQNLEYLEQQDNKEKVSKIKQKVKKKAQKSQQDQAYHIQKLKEIEMQINKLKFQKQQISQSLQYSPGVQRKDPQLPASITKYANNKLETETSNLIEKGEGLISKTLKKQIKKYKRKVSNNIEDVFGILKNDIDTKFTNFLDERINTVEKQYNQSQIKKLETPNFGDTIRNTNNFITQPTNESSYFVFSPERTKNPQEDSSLAIKSKNYNERKNILEELNQYRNPKFSEYYMQKQR